MFYFPAPRYAEPFTAEMAGPLEGNGHLARIITEYKTAFPSKKIAVHFSSDSQSWIKTLARGPLAISDYAVQLWNAFETLANLADIVVVGFKFGHCDDPKSDVVDAAAKQAAKLKLQCSDPWNVDVTGRELRRFLKTERTALFNTCGSFIRYSCPTSDRPEKLVPLPPDNLPPGVAKDVIRLRTGHWWRMGLHTIFHKQPPQACPLCGEVELSRDLGPAVQHIFECPAASSLRNTSLAASQPSHLREPPVERMRPQAQQLFVEESEHILAIHEYCLQFAVLDPNVEPESTPESRAMSTVPVAPPAVGPGLSYSPQRSASMRLTGLTQSLSMARADAPRLDRSCSRALDRDHTATSPPPERTAA